MRQIYLDYWFNAETEHLNKMLGDDVFVKIVGNPGGGDLRDPQTWPTMNLNMASRYNSK